MLFRDHPFFPIFQTLISSFKGIGTVYDLGTSRRYAKEVGLVKDLIDDESYFAGGYYPDSTLEAPCDFHCDVHTLSDIKSDSAGGVICLSVLEHVVNPAQALKSFYRVLKEDGILIASVPFFIGYHGKSNNNYVFEKEKGLKINSTHDHYSDFWRFTHEGLALLFLDAGFKRVEIYPIDGPIVCRLEMLGIFRFLYRLPIIKSIIKLLDKPKLGKITTCHFIRAVK